MNSYFVFNNIYYESGTIIQIKQSFISQFKFCSKLIFREHNSNNNTYVFSALHDQWEVFIMTDNQLNLYIEGIVEDNHVDVNVNKIKECYIDGIVDGWAWYILIMFGGLFLKEIENAIIIWVFASIIFFTWRHKKMNGE